MSQWPMILDMSRDDSRKHLRCLELEAYSSIVAVFRAQGDLSPEKKALLQQLQAVLSISTERHRAEVRKCVNDEKLTTTAMHQVGCNHDCEWLIEGRRIAPATPRLLPQTAFTQTANQAAMVQIEKNAMLNSPSSTGNRESLMATSVLPTVCATPTTSTPTASVQASMPNHAPVTKFSRASSPNTNVVVLPSGTSIHIKGGLNLDEEEDITGVKRRRTSAESTFVTSKAINTRAGPMKITLSKPAISSSSSQKVILVSSSGPSATTTIPQRSTTVPVVKSVTPVTSYARTSVVYPASAGSPNHSDSHPITTGPSINTNQGIHGIGRYRPKVTMSSPRVKSPSVSVSRPGMVIPVGSTMSSRTVKPGIQIKQEGGSKILPKPSSLSTPIVVVTSSGPTRTATSTSSVQISSGKVISISTGKVLGTAPTKAPAVVKTVSQKTLSVTKQLTATTNRISLTSSQGQTTVTTATGQKPGNVVIVQQQSQPSRSTTAVTVTQSLTKPSVNTIERDFVSFIQKQAEVIKQPPAKITQANVRNITQPEVKKTTQAEVRKTTQAEVRKTTQAEVTKTTQAEMRKTTQAEIRKTTLVEVKQPTHADIKTTPTITSTNITVHNPNTTNTLQTKSSILAGLIHSDQNSAVTSKPSIEQKASDNKPGWYVSSQPSQTGQNLQTSHAAITNTQTTTASQPEPKLDIFSSALAEAQINLDPYEFIDEDEPMSNTAVTWSDTAWSSNEIMSPTLPVELTPLTPEKSQASNTFLSEVSSYSQTPIMYTNPSLVYRDSNQLPTTYTTASSLYDTSKTQQQTTLCTPERQVLSVNLADPVTVQAVDTVDLSEIHAWPVSKAGLSLTTTLVSSESNAFDAMPEVVEDQAESSYDTALQMLIPTIVAQTSPEIETRTFTKSIADLDAKIQYVETPTPNTTSTLETKDKWLDSENPVIKNFGQTESAASSNRPPQSSATTKQTINVEEQKSNVSLPILDNVVLMNVKPSTELTISQSLLDDASKLISAIEESAPLDSCTTGVVSSCSDMPDNISMPKDSLTSSHELPSMINLTDRTICTLSDANVTVSTETSCETSLQDYNTAQSEGLMEGGDIKPVNNKKPADVENCEVKKEAISSFLANENTDVNITVPLEQESTLDINNSLLATSNVESASKENLEYVADSITVPAITAPAITESSITESAITEPAVTESAHIVAERSSVHRSCYETNEKHAHHRKNAATFLKNDSGENDVLEALLPKANCVKVESTRCEEVVFQDTISDKVVFQQLIYDQVGSQESKDDMVVSSEMPSNKVTSQESPACDKVISQESTCDKVVSLESICNKVVSQETTCDKVVSQESSACDKVTYQESTCDKVVSPDSSAYDKVVSQESSACDKVTYQELTCDKVVSQESTCDKVVSKKTTCDKAISQETICDRVVSQETTCDKVLYQEACDKVISQETTCGMVTSTKTCVEIEPHKECFDETTKTEQPDSIDSTRTSLKLADNQIKSNNAGNTTILTTLPSSQQSSDVLQNALNLEETDGANLTDLPDGNKSLVKTELTLESNLHSEKSEVETLISGHSNNPANTSKTTSTEELPTLSVIANGYQKESQKSANNNGTECHNTKLTACETDAVSLHNELPSPTALTQLNGIVSCRTPSVDEPSDDSQDVFDTMSETLGDKSVIQTSRSASERTIHTYGRKRRRRSENISWSKAASGLLKRVMMFRGANRGKAEHGAAAWFLRPVSDEEAPGYSAMISTPMDFGSIKKKLDFNTYKSLDEFHHDMMLVYKNCCTYNPPEHNVRRDCEQVFVFFEQEFDKLTNKLEQVQKKAKLSSSTSQAVS